MIDSKVVVHVVVVMPMCFTAALQRIYFDVSRKIAKEKDIVCLDAAGKCT